MRRALVLVFVLTAAVPLLAQQALVSYLDGRLELQRGTAWVELSIGDPLQPTDMIRLGGNSYAEIRSGATTVKLSRAGTFRVGDLVDSTGRAQSTGVGSLVLRRVGTLTTDTGTTQTAAGGVRASEAVKDTGPAWAGGETVAELIEEGLRLLGNDDLAGARYLFEEAYDYALTDREHAQASFYYGYALSLAGYVQRGLELLLEFGPDPDTDYYEVHALALSQLLVESFSFEDAVGYLTPLTKVESTPVEDRQYAHLLLGMAYEGLGLIEQARASFRSARAVLPGTPAADAAGRLLADL